MVSHGERDDCRTDLVHGAELLDGAVHGACVAHGLDDVPRAGLALGAQHRRTLGDAAKRLAEALAAADEGGGELVLVRVVTVVGHGEHLALVDEVHAHGLQHLRLHEVPDARLRHDGDGDAGLDGVDHVGIGHARDAAVAADVGRDALEGHHRHGARLLGDARLRGRRHVHDHATLEHLGEAGLDLPGGLDRRAGGGAALGSSARAGHDGWCLRSAVCCGALFCVGGARRCGMVRRAKGGRGGTAQRR